MREITIKIEYEKLYFDDLIYVFNSLIRTTIQFYEKEEYWYDDAVYNYLLEHDIKIAKDEYYKSIPALKKIIQKSITYQIIEFSKGSIRIKSMFVIVETALVPLISAINLPAGITISVITELAGLIYSEHEKDFDDRINKLKSRWETQSTKKGRKERKIIFRIE